MSEAAVAVIPIPKDQLTRLETIEAITTIDSAEAEVVAVDALAFVKAINRNLDKARRELVDPLNERVKQVNDGFRPMTDRLTKIEDATKKALIDWRRRERERVEAEQRRVERENRERERLAREEEERQRREVAENTANEAAAAGFTEDEAAELAELESADVAVAPVIREVTPAPVANMTTATLGTAVGRKVWTFAITDSTQVPRAYCSVDLVKIRKAMGAGIREMPGVLFYQEEQIAGRSAS